MIGHRCADERNDAILFPFALPQHCRMLLLLCHNLPRTTTHFDFDTEPDLEHCCQKFKSRPSEIVHHVIRNIILKRQYGVENKWRRIIGIPLFEIHILSAWEMLTTADIFIYRCAAYLRHRIDSKIFDIVSGSCNVCSFVHLPPQAINNRWTSRTKLNPSIFR